MSSSDNEAKSVDWCAHRQEYVINHAPNGVSARKYLIDQGLNVNTGRRQFTAISKLEEQGLSYDDIKTQLFGGSKSIQRSAPKSGSGKGGSVKRGSTTKKVDPVDPKPKTRSTSAAKKTNKINAQPRVKAEGSAPADKERSKNIRRLTNPLQQAYIDRSSDQQIGNGGRFTKGNTAAVRTCGYMDLVHADSDIIDRIVNTALGDVSGVVGLSMVRYVQMEVMLADRLAAIERQAAEGRLPRDHNNQEVSKEDLQREALWGSSGVMTGLLGTLTMAKTQASKAEFEREIKEYRLRREIEDREHVAKVYEEHFSDENATALDLAKKLEARGLKPSPIIVAQALKEIELMAPKIDTSGITDEELDAEVAAYQEQLKADVDAVVSRKAELERLMLESKARIQNAGLEEDEFNEAFADVEDEEGDAPRSDIEIDDVSFHSDDFEGDQWG